jgi:hypothetical protein
MSIIAKRPKDNFVPAPVGTYAAVCVDVEDLGEKLNPYKPEAPPKPKIRLSWQLAERMPDGRPYLVSCMCTLTLHERSTLFSHVEAWIGPLTPSELEGFEVESLIGKSCMVSISHSKKPDGKIFANVDTVLQLPKGMTAPKPDGYVRKIDRPLVSQPRGTRARNGAAAASVPGWNDVANANDDPTEYEADRAVLDRKVMSKITGRVSSDVFVPVRRPGRH